ncbi:DNA-binding transcriptional regulator, ArsR family [Sphingobium faniae]|nr:DNA-binding transcriptional regulator, ArsR family [Sphingobium faniae]
MPLAERPDPARLFAALGDPTRLSFVAQLADGRGRSIVQMSDGLPISRQAVARHLDVLRQAGLVQRTRNGREVHFALRREAVEDARLWLDKVGAQWDATLARFKSFMEGGV